MLDWTDRHYRHMARQITRHTWLYTEMINAGAVIYGDPDRFLLKNDGENPVALQLGGSEPQDLAKAAAKAAAYGYDEINLNFMYQHSLRKRQHKRTTSFTLSLITLALVLLSLLARLFL